jgi:branched-chain amino acid transport system ATP-binding protein
LADATPPFLRLENLVAGYGRKQILNGLQIEVALGEVVAIIGHNGAGKSTLLKVIFGMLPIWQGSMVVSGTEVPIPSPRDLLKKGIAYLPQGNRVFGDLTVHENLEMGGVTLPNRFALEERVKTLLSKFPHLKARLRQRASTLSGGEKQMLALACALMLSPRMLLLDEPSLGLSAPVTLDALQKIKTISRETGAGILLVEQKVREALQIADRVYVMRNGVVSYSGQSVALRDEAKLREVYF